MKPNCTKNLSLICLLLFSVQVLFLYANNAEISNLTTKSIFASVVYETNNEVHKPLQSGTDSPEPEQEEKEESQENQENEESKELEVLSDDLNCNESTFIFTEMNYYYLLKPSDGINQEHYCPPECKI